MKRFKPSVEPVPVPTMPQISNQGLPVIGRNAIPQSLPENIRQNMPLNDRLNQKFNISNTSMQANKAKPTQVMPGIPPIPPIPTKPKQKWACVEERIQNGLEYGSVIRKEWLHFLKWVGLRWSNGSISDACHINFCNIEKIIFGDLYKNPSDTVPAENNFNVSYHDS